MTRDANLEEGIMEHLYENLDIIPADHSARSIDIMMDEMKSSKKRLKGSYNN